MPPLKCRRMVRASCVRARVSVSVDAALKLSHPQIIAAWYSALK